MGAIPAARGTIRFDVFEADLRAGELRKQGTKLKLQDQPFQVLRILLEHAGEVVTRDELQERIWPSDTFVDFEQGLYNAIKRLREALDDSADTPRLIETLPRRGYRFIGPLKQSCGRIESLLVLPLENLSRDPGQEYFADGMTEALISILAKIGALRVISRTTAMHYKTAHRPLPEIADELGVDGVVEGTVLHCDGRVRISVQLIQAPTDTHLWTETYDRDLRDVLALQSEVAQAIAREIQVKLTPQEQAQFAQTATVTPQAYEAYLKGRSHWNRRPRELGKAIPCFEQAIAKDPAYAAAYAGLSHCLSISSVFGFVSNSQGCVKGKRLAQEALQLDHGLAEAHVSLALATMCDYDFSIAEKEFERAIELNPRDATAHQDFGLFLGMMGRYEEGYTELQRAIRLDPLSAVIQGTLGYIYVYGRRYDQAIEQFERTLRLDSNSGLAQCGIGWAYRCKSSFDLAIAAYQKGTDLWPGSTPLSWFAETYAAAGCRHDAHRILRQLDAFPQERYVTPYGVARVYATLGETEQAFRWLETAHRERANWMSLLKVDPSMDVLRSDPRFQDLMRRMKFPA